MLGPSIGDSPPHLCAEEKEHFYECQHCGEMVNNRQLVDDVLFHEDHKRRPDIQYEGSERIA